MLANDDLFIPTHQRHARTTNDSTIRNMKNIQMIHKHRPPDSETVNKTGKTLGSKLRNARTNKL